jgi:2-methylcitrate dehydratase PrpD
MENVLFKISFPAEFHSQTAVECAMTSCTPRSRTACRGYRQKITITHPRGGIRIIDKKGPLNNPADRDHCIQYMAAVGLIKGNLTAADYEDEAAANPLIDQLRDKMECVELKQYSLDYHDPEKRSIANAIQVFFKDGTATEQIAVEYPIGHRRRRAEGIPELIKKYKVNLGRRFPAKQQAAILNLCMDRARLEATPVNEFNDLFVI